MAGIKSYAISNGAVTKAEADVLLNLDSSLSLKASLAGSGITATQASYYAARGLIPPSDVIFDLDYVKSYVIDGGQSFGNTVTVNTPFSEQKSFKHG